MTAYPHPDEVLSSLLAKGCRRDKVDKLRKLHELCSLESSRNSRESRDLSLSSMARMAEEKGLFKARTIYNKQSEDYQTLIKAWETFDGPKNATTSRKPAEPSDKYAFLKKIDDPAIRSLCHMAIIERDKLRAEINLLKSKTEVIIDMRPLGADVAKGATNVAIIDVPAQLTDSERNALTAAIDSETLARRKWRLGETGEILDELDRFIFLPGFATAIAKFLGRLQSPLLQSKERRK